MSDSANSACPIRKERELGKIFVFFAVCNGEITPSRQKKETSFFVMLSTFRNFAAKLTKEQTR